MANQNPKPQYLALTIGPILKTLFQARKTRELWAASYLLSSLMKHLIQQLDPKEQYLLIPRIPASVKGKTLYGAGIYPDRLFMEADHLTEGAVHTAIEASITELMQELGTSTTDLKAYLPFWQQFFRIRFVLMHVPKIENGQLSQVLSPFLDCLELEDTCFPENADFQNRLHEVFKRFFQIPLTQALKGKANRGTYDPILTGTAVFPSTSDIGTFDLYEKMGEAIREIKAEFYDEIEENHEALYLKLEKDLRIESHFKQRHKYFCIVQADGDNIGAAIQQLNNRADYIRFSEILAEYGADAAEIINSYGGKPIYIGGDDLLFLAPVRSEMGTVFDLIAALRAAFPKAKLDPSGAMNPAPSLSFGVNIVYYKYPLFEAIGDAYGLLKTAKGYTAANGEKKNSICFQFTKHSGSKFSGVFSQAFFKKMLKSVKTLDNASIEGRDGMVSSLIFKLFTLERLLSDLARNIQKQTTPSQVNAEFEARLEETFTHFYNEWEKHDGFEVQKKAIIQLLLAAHQEYGADGEWLHLCYSTLRLIQFMIASPDKMLSHDSENIAETAA